MNILIIHTGGTISCTYENGILTPRADIAPMIDRIFKTQHDVKLSHKHICSVLSENTDGKILNKIISGVRKHVLSGKYDGVIVTLGSDTLAYTSAAISYAIGRSRVPCVTVCSNLPLSVPTADRIANLKAAVAVIRSGKVKGALTVYPEKDGQVSVYRASRIMQQPPYFSAPVPAGETYGTVKDGNFFKNGKYVEGTDTFTIDKPIFSALSPIFLLNVYPGMTYPSLPRRTRAVILGTYHSGTLNTQSQETAKFAKHCKKRGIKVYVSAVTDGADYESMSVYEELSFIRLPALSSPAAMYIKLWLLNSHTRKFTDEKLLSPLGGDLVAASVKPSSKNNVEGMAQPSASNLSEETKAFSKSSKSKETSSCSNSYITEYDTSVAEEN